MLHKREIEMDCELLPQKLLMEVFEGMERASAIRSLVQKATAPLAHCFAVGSKWASVWLLAEAAERDKTVLDMPFMGYTPLDLAILCGHDKILHTLLKLGANPNNKAGMTFTLHNPTNGKVFAAPGMFINLWAQLSFLYRMNCSHLMLTFTPFFSSPTLHSDPLQAALVRRDTSPEEIFRGKNISRIEKRDRPLGNKPRHQHAVS